MYCSGCGSLVNNKLKYCKNCGAKLVKDEEDDSPKSILEGLLTTLSFVALGGLGILVGLVAVLLKNGIDHKGVLIISIFYLAALFGICYMILSQVPKLIDAKLKQKTEKDEFTPPVQLSAPITAQLEEHREPVRSVTENTTRTFDKIPRMEN